jgi:hypothetical protein
MPSPTQDCEDLTHRDPPSASLCLWPVSRFVNVNFSLFFAATATSFGVGRHLSRENRRAFRAPWRRRAARTMTLPNLGSALSALSLHKAQAALRDAVAHSDDSRGCAPAIGLAFPIIRDSWREGRNGGVAIGKLTEQSWNELNEALTGDSPLPPPPQLEQAIGTLKQTHALVHKVDPHPPDETPWPEAPA